MINTSITIGQYIPGDSIIHRADPRTKILLSIAFMVVIFLVNSFWTFTAMALFVLLTVIISGVPVKYTLRGLKPIMFIIIFTAVINIFTTGGTPISQTVPFKYITWEGIILALRLAIRLALIIISGSLLTFTTTPILLTDGIEKLLSPFRKIGLPAHELAMMMSIALRFIPTLLEETDKIMKAQAARGADFDTGNLIQRAKSFVPVLVPLFVSAFRRADELATAMEARCYRGGTGRTRLRSLEFTDADVRIAVVTFIFFTGLLLLEYL
ncbi:MAG: energy-coupling factor transporter transmembrane component T [Acetivibrionales bacterium]|jgi:energy-coupling factor transport system permease protein|nr:energy-coupling factor transporter transmembrane component T [Bacillota bacterium]NLP08112.1 energy-coupling factor transporter transmembrane protein EcfT [Clostridiaceae bacterium]HQD31586.1 energy-coupling factor transporter transmembrane component T [Clostridiales bacterium]